MELLATFLLKKCSFKLTSTMPRKSEKDSWFIDFSLPTNLNSTSSINLKRRGLVQVLLLDNIIISKKERSSSTFQLLMLIGKDSHFSTKIQCPICLCGLPSLQLQLFPSTIIFSKETMNGMQQIPKYFKNSSCHSSLKLRKESMKEL